MPRGKKDVEKSTSTEKNSRSKTNTNPLPPISTTTTITTTATLQQHNAVFSKKDFERLSVNEHGRYIPNSNKVGSAVIMAKEGKTVALQYPLPIIPGGTLIKEDDNSNFSSFVPEVRPLINFEAIEPYPGMHRYRAETPDGHTKMFAKRSVKAKIGNASEQEATEVEIACFSPNPREKQGKDVFWGSIKPTPVFKDDLPKMGKAVKGGHDLQIDYASVRERERMSRNPTQEGVMGKKKAVDAYKDYYTENVNVLHDKMKERLSRAFNANFYGGLAENNYRPEWTHLYGWSMAPMDTNPQTADNLVAGPKWANTQMMLLERVVKWFSFNSPESSAVINTKSDMLPGSHLYRHMDFAAKVQLKEKYVQLMQSIDPFLEYPVFPKSSDLPQMAGITYYILHGIAPLSTQEVNQPRKPATRQQTAIRQAAAAPSAITATQTTAPLPPPLQAINTAVAPAIPANAVMSPGAGLPPAQYDALLNKLRSDLKRKRQDSSSDEEPDHKRRNTKQQFPTQQEYQKSIVQVYTDSFAPNYAIPWQAPEAASCTGSGLVIAHAGKNYVLTNAHVAENAQFMQVRIANSRHNKYEAKAKVVAYQCDLALLEVDDPEFNQLVEPAQLGEMVSLRQEVMTVGFPMGGTEMSISTGIVSRIQTDEYAMSGQDLLVVGIDAALNPGNSGGPVFSNGKVVGIGFQIVEGHQGLGYMIPIPIVRRFLAEAFSGQQYRDFPTLPIWPEPLENIHERQYHGMSEEQSGVLISKVYNLCDAHSKLKANDVLLSIDGLPISNQGTVDIPGIGNCIDMTHVMHMKHRGDTVKLQVLRHNADLHQSEILDIDVVLNTAVGDTAKVSVLEHDKMPTFYINSGLGFMPLTRNYMALSYQVGLGQSEPIFNDPLVLEEGCALSVAPKKNKDDQVVVFTHIIDCKDTQGYDDYLNEVVQEVNGKPINNMRDLVEAMEGNTGPVQVINFAGKSNPPIVVPNMSKSRFQQLLKQHHIPASCSDDLIDQVNNRVVVAVPEKDEESTTVDDESLSAGMTPGMEMTRALFAGIVDRYKNVAEDEDEELVVADTDLVESSNEDDDDTEVEEEAHLEVRVAPRLHRHNAIQKHGFFNKFSKKQDDEEQAPEVDRKHGGWHGRR